MLIICDVMSGANKILEYSHLVKYFFMNYLF